MKLCNECKWFGYVSHNSWGECYCHINPEPIKLPEYLIKQCKDNFEEKEPKEEVMKR